VSDRSDLDRTFALQRWVLETSSTRSEELDWGTAFFNDEFPKKYDANMILADRPLGDLAVDEVIATLDRLYDGMRHREIELTDGADAERLGTGMAEQGYVIDRLVVMAHRREPDREPDLDAAEVTDPAEARPLLLEGTRREPWGKEDGVAEHLVAHDEVLLRSVEGTLFTQRVQGQLAGSCELYVHGDVAQVENVSTLEEFQGRGVARNVVLRAVHEAKAAGANLVFLFADADDWPQRLYSRLGFDEIGRSLVYMRVPEHERAEHEEIPGG
jgi:ribosomal protein S18 acetylase RimI-like enzyme